MKYFSLFSGIGGFELGIKKSYVDSINRSKKRGKQKNSQKNDEEGEGLESKKRKNIRAKKRRSGEHTEHWDNEGEPTCVGYSEIDKYAIQVYEKHFKHKNYGDIKKIDAETLPDFDLLVGGFPCQSFSIAGKRRGFEDTRGTLFFDIARILKEKRPRLMLLENVKGLLSHDNGRTFFTIIATLDELGYDLQWQVLNSKNHGVPQNRERIFIVGHIRGTPRPKVFPFGEGDSVVETPRDQEGKKVANTLRAKLGGPDLENSYMVVQKSQDWREKGTLREFRKVAPTIRASMGDNHPMIMQRGRGKNLGGVHSISPTVSSNSFQDNNHVVAGALGATYYKGDNRPGNKSNRTRVHENGGIRRLTPVECERLQGFPDGWTEGISDTQRYKCLGNAVTVNVIQAITEKLL